MALPDVIHQIAAEQNGVVSRAQLAASGVSPGLIRWHGGRHWRALLPGVLMLNTGPPSQDQRLIAALLYAGPNSWLAGVSAAQWHGLDPSPSSLPVQVYVPHPQRSRRVAWVTIRATRLGNERLVERGTLRVSCRSRALVDAAADASDERAARRLIVGEVSDRLVRIDDVQHWISVRRRNGTLRLKRAAAEAAAGSWSVPEAELARVLSRSRVLSSLCANPSLVDVLGRRLTTPDLWADDVGLAVMVHSRQFHGSELDWDATVTADEDLRAAVMEVVPVTPSAIEMKSRSGAPARRGRVSTCSGPSEAEPGRLSQGLRSPGGVREPESPLMRHDPSIRRRISPQLLLPQQLGVQADPPTDGAADPAAVQAADQSAGQSAGWVLGREVRDGCGRRWVGSAA